MKNEEEEIDVNDTPNTTEENAIQNVTAPSEDTLNHSVSTTLEHEDLRKVEDKNCFPDVEKLNVYANESDLIPSTHENDANTDEIEDRLNVENDRTPNAEEDEMKTDGKNTTPSAMEDNVNAIEKDTMLTIMKDKAGTDEIEDRFNSVDEDVRTGENDCAHRKEDDDMVSNEKEVTPPTKEEDSSADEIECIRNDEEDNVKSDEKDNVPAITDPIATTWDADDTELSTLAKELRDNVLNQGDTLASTAHEFWVHACLYARKGDISRSSKLLRSLVQSKIKLTPDEHQRVPELLHRGAVWSSGARDRLGRHVLHIRIRHADPAEFTPDDLVRALALASEWTIRTYHAARTHGVVVLADAAGTGFGGIDTRLPGTLMHAFSRTMPLRVAAFCVLNPPWFFRAILAVGTALMGAKLRARVKVFGRPEELAKHFDVDSVPIDSEMGGELEWDLDVQHRWAEEVIEAAKSWPPIVDVPEKDENDEEAENNQMDIYDENIDVDTKSSALQEETMKEVVEVVGVEEIQEIGKAINNE